VLNKEINLIKKVHITKNQAMPYSSSQDRGGGWISFADKSRNVLAKKHKNVLVFELLCCCVHHHILLLIPYYIYVITVLPK
jgi:hypothetical protein